MTCAPNLIAAASNDMCVRVEGSKNRHATIRPCVRRKELSDPVIGDEVERGQGKQGQMREQTKDAKECVGLWVWEGCVCYLQDGRD